MSKRKTIDIFFKKKDVSNSEIRTPVAVDVAVSVVKLFDLCCIPILVCLIFVFV